MRWFAAILIVLAQAADEKRPHIEVRGIYGAVPSEHRKDEFRAVLEKFEIDGVWLDYHHAHASWEQAKPVLPDTCFCKGCLDRFSKETKIEAAPADLLGK